LQIPAFIKEDHSGGGDGDVSLALAVGAPFIGYVGGSWLMAAHFNAALDAWIGLILGHLVWACFLGLSTFSAEADKDGKRPAYGAAVIGTFVAMVILLVWIFLLPAIIYQKNAFHKRHCYHNLKHLGLSMAMYGNEQDGEAYPPLSPKAGCLMPEIGNLHPEYLGDLTLIHCPELRDPRLPLSPESEFAAVLSDQSYFYLGYIIDGPETLRAFQKAYEKVIAEGGSFESALSVPAGQGTWGGDRIPRLSEDPSIVYPDFDETNEEHVAAAYNVRSKIPVMIERIGNHPIKGKKTGELAHVLFQDGQVKWMNFPGEWPMTEETQNILNALDKLGPYVPEGAITIPRQPPYELWVLLAFVIGTVLFVLWRFLRFSAVTLPLFYLLFGLTLCGLVLFQESVLPGLPVATPDGEVTEHLLEAPAEDGA